MTYTHVILVDENDQATGTAEKLVAHQQGLLHRAFSIFLYRINPQGEIELLLQKRANSKYHCGGLWSNTCCSHPYEGKDILTCAHERLKFEMGIEGQTLKFADKFLYKATCPNGLTEHEVDHIFIGEFSPTTFTPNAEEVEDYQWVEVVKLKQNINKNPNQFTPWLSDVLTHTLPHLPT